MGFMNSRGKLERWLIGTGVILIGVLVAVFAAKWLEATLGLPELIFQGRRGPSDFTQMILGLLILIAYIYTVPRMCGISLKELGHMLKGE